ncbi:MAG TPA: DUF456 domain-containing protein [Gemmatimonadaceae bacterium]|nr:DUF456 domain-containing protein [Gemmatimonadaceae bacterium]
MEILILAVVLLVSLLLIPLGLPGTWVMIVAAALYDYLVPGTNKIGTAAIVGSGVLAAIGEWFEFTLGAKYARKYGGSRRAGWGAIIGGIVGAFAGIPVPVIGSMIGAFAGSFVGALLFEYTRGRDANVATRVAWGALIGRVAAVAAKSAVGCVIAAWLLLAAVF